jgi:hypothetical protein
MKATYNGIDVIVVSYLANDMVRITYTGLDGIVAIDEVPQSEVTIVN